MEAFTYSDMRIAVERAGYAHEIEWAQTVKSPTTPEALWREYAWVIINSGMQNQIAERIWVKVRRAVEEGGSASDVFGHEAKCEAIDGGWLDRRERFSTFLGLIGPPDEVVEWCGSLPWIGPITKWHLAKNLGVDCAKPDRWLERVAGAAGEAVTDLCRRLWPRPAIAWPRWIS